MVETQTIERSWARGLRSSLILLAALVCNLPTSIVFAAAPLYEQHPVLVPWIEDVLGADRALKRERRAEHSLISRATHTPCFSIEHPAPLPQFTPLLPAFGLCVGVVAASADATGWPGYEARGDHARSAGNWAEAEPAYATAIQLLERTTDHEGQQNLAALLNKVGSVRYQRQDFTGAETALRHALQIYTATHGAEDLQVADTLHELAKALFAQPQGRDLAGPLCFRAWVVRERVLGPDHPAVAESLHLLALSLYPNELSTAVLLLLQALAIREQTYGPTHPSVAETLTAMAGLYDAHHRHDLATPLYQEALIIRETVFGPDATETQQVRQRLMIAP